LKNAIELLFSSALWGGSFLFLRISAPVFGPIVLIEFRVAIALLVMLPFLLIYDKFNDLRTHWRLIAVLALMNMSVPFCLFACATLSVGAGSASILNATVPFFAALIALLLYGQRLSRPAIPGLVIGFSRVVLLALSGEEGVGVKGSLIALNAGLFA
jgi:drug/metabolite transporter (DMT)-like permease